MEAKQSAALYALHAIEEALVSIIRNILIVSKPNEFIALCYESGPSYSPVPASVKKIDYFPIVLGVKQCLVTSRGVTLQLKSFATEMSLCEGIDIKLKADDLHPGSSVIYKRAIFPWEIHSMVRD